jgi:hypothetical protein
MPIEHAPAQTLRHMTAEQWLYLGLSQLVCLRSAILGGERAFMICSATGAILDVFDMMRTAVARVAENGFSLALVH